MVCYVRDATRGTNRKDAFRQPPTKAQSARSGNISKCGDKLMRHALYEAANSHLRISKKWSVLRAWGVKLAKRVGAKKACVAVARKLAIVMHRMWIDGTDFRFGQPPAVRAAWGSIPVRCSHQARAVSILA
jgi:hypothetical protein